MRDDAVKPPQQTLVDAFKRALPPAVRRVLARGRQAVVPPPSQWNGRMPFLADAMRRTQTQGPRPFGARPRIVHLIGTLGPGGAERQLCNSVIAMKRLGHDVRVILMWEPEGDHGHYLYLLHQEGVDVSVAGAAFHPGFPEAVNRVPGSLAAVRQIPPECWPVTVDVLGTLLTDRPDVLHTWLDGSNVWGGIAGVLAQVPLIVLSTRNVNPSNFPVLDLPFFRQAYGELLQSPRVRLINNSYPGAEDYARWLGIPVDRISVVLNGLDLSRLHNPSPEAIAEFRRQHAIDHDVPLIAGVFRLAEEKQPFTFLAVVHAVLRRCPSAVVAIAGIGPLEREMREYRERARLSRFRTLPRPLEGCDSPVWRRQRDALVLAEGRHAQHSARSAVARMSGRLHQGRRRGGCRRSWCHRLSVRRRRRRCALPPLSPGWWRSAALRARMSAEGPPFIVRRFSVGRMVAETLKLYGITHESEHRD